jgi:hypothetical protein
MKTPIIITGPCEVLNDFYGEDGTKAVRLPDGTHVTLALGRELAKKVLTWEDIKTIVQIADDLDPLYDPDALDAELQTEEALYTEVLKRFQEGRP